MTTKVDMSGPWEAYAVDRDGLVLDPYDENDDLSQCHAVTVVRRSAAPTPAFSEAPRLPSTLEFDDCDVLYRVGDLIHRPERVPLVLAQAIETAEALNRHAAR